MAIFLPPMFRCPYYTLFTPVFPPCKSPISIAKSKVRGIEDTKEQLPSSRIPATRHRHVAFQWVQFTKKESPASGRASLFWWS